METITDSALDEVVRRLVDALQPERIYLFGSRAYGQPTADSDIDILVVVPQSELPGHRRDRLAYQALWALPLPVEVLVFTRAEFDRGREVAGSLPATVARRGRLLYGR